MNGSFSKLHAVSFGLALGIIWGLGMLITAIFASFTGWGSMFITTMGSVYIGYSPTFIGALIGGALGFLDGFIGGFSLALSSLQHWSMNKRPIKSA